MTVLRHRIWRTRYLLLRRATQLLVMLLLMGAVVWNWSVLRGNLSFSIGHLIFLEVKSCDVFGIESQAIQMSS